MRHRMKRRTATCVRKAEWGANPVGLRGRDGVSGWTGARRGAVRKRAYHACGSENAGTIPPATTTPHPRNTPTDRAVAPGSVPRRHDASDAYHATSTRGADALDNIASTTPVGRNAPAFSRVATLAVRRKGWPFGSLTWVVGWLGDWVIGWLGDWVIG